MPLSITATVCLASAKAELLAGRCDVRPAVPLSRQGQELADLLRQVLVELLEGSRVDPESATGSARARAALRSTRTASRGGKTADRRASA